VAAMTNKGKQKQKTMMRCETSSTPTAVVHFDTYLDQSSIINTQSPQSPQQQTIDGQTNRTAKNETKIFVAKGEKSNVAALSMIDDGCDRMKTCASNIQILIYSITPANNNCRR
jgi:hypothetical protein